MFRRILRWVNGCVLIFALSAPAAVQAQRERILDPVSDGDYGREFFDELSRLFGRFRDTELRRAFQLARRIECAELVADDGEWRQVAFFNDDRRLGDWYRTSLAEVNGDLSRYVFKGSCGADASLLRLTTKFPVLERVDAYTAGRIHLDEIDVNVNAPVDAVYDPRTQAYAFDLPYLYLVGREGTGNLYSLVAPRLSDRYAQGMAYHWDCKAVRDGEVTYRFLICRATTVSFGVVQRNQAPITSPPGSSAYFILSDGKEAGSTVRLAFGAAPDSPDSPLPPARPPVFESSVRPSPSLTVWGPPAGEEPLKETGRKVFRIVFNLQTWRNRIASPQILSDQKMSDAPSSVKPPGDMDYCAWQPAATPAVERLLARNPDEEADFSISTLDRNQENSASIAFNMKTHTGLRLGALQCFFPRARLAAEVTGEQWIAVVGGHLTIEILP